MAGVGALVVAPVVGRGVGVVVGTRVEVLVIGVEVGVPLAFGGTGVAELSTAGTSRVEVGVAVWRFGVTVGLGVADGIGVAVRVAVDVGVSSGVEVGARVFVAVGTTATAPPGGWAMPSVGAGVAGGCVGMSTAAGVRIELMYRLSLIHI